MAAVSIESVSKVFPGGVKAVDDVSLEVADGEFLVLVGPSGCGKSTLLRTIAGLEEPTAGTIRIGDRDVTRVEPKRRDVAMVFQNYALYPHMTVFHNMAFGLKLAKRPRREIAERVEAAARLLGLEDLLKRKPAALSGGQRQRVAVGRAIVRDPAVFLFDEPLSNLDALLRVEMRRELAALHRRLSATMIYVTHDQVEAMTLGERVVVMRDGLVQQLGKPLDVYDRPANRFVAGFLGSPPMNVLEGAVHRDESGCRFAFGSASLPLPSSLAGERCERIAAIGVRPEHVELVEGASHAAALKAAVVDVQPLGSETLVELAVGSATITARVDAHLVPGIGDDVGVRFDARRLHGFGADGVRIG